MEPRWNDRQAIDDVLENLLHLSTLAMELSGGIRSAQNRLRAAITIRTGELHAIEEKLVTAAANPDCTTQDLRSTCHEASSAIAIMRKRANV